MKLLYKIIFLTTLFTLAACVGNTLSAQKKFTLVIDAGHGGRDPGAIGAKSKEKDINLAVALKIGKLIESNHKDVNVIYTRKTDVYLPLLERADVANKNHADLFISIHANAAKNKSAYGTETFTFGLSKTQSNLDVAMRENSVILLEDDYKTRYEGFDPNSVESYIMFEFMQDKYMDRSIEFASNVQERFVSDCKRHDRGVRQSELIVLHRSACPSALIELGFISNAEEEKYMTSGKGQNELSEAIYNAFDKYKRNHDKRSGVVLTNQTQQTESAVSTANGEPVFKIQLFIAKDKLKSNAKEFKGLKNTEYYKEGGWYKYTIGNTSDYAGIQKLKKEIQAKFPEAFIIAFVNESKVPVNEALELLKKQ